MGPIIDAAKRAQERTVDVERYTDAIRLAACVMTSDGPGGAARRAQEKGWTRVAEAITKATVAGGTVGANSIANLVQPSARASVIQLSSWSAAPRANSTNRFLA